VEQTDGRRLRSERSRQAIIDATLAFMEEGCLIPTAQQISDRAGVGIRSFFRHFEDMDTLFASIDDQIRDSAEALFLGGDRDGSLEERVLHAVERRAEGYEIEKNIVLSTSALMWRHEILRKNYARYQRGLRKDLDDWLPELKALPAATREAVDAVTSFEMWHRLRYHQNLGRKAAIGVVVELLRGLLDD
jgi:AcrR family transcriptional regulator